MTVGGRSNKRYVGLYSLDANNPVLQCPQNIKVLPEDRYYSAGAGLGSGKLI